MAEKSDIFVFSEKPALQAELISAAHSLTAHTGGQVIALVLGQRSDAELALKQGAQTALWLGELPPDRLVEDVVPTITAAVQSQPSLWGFDRSDSSWQGGSRAAVSPTGCGSPDGCA